MAIIKIKSGNKEIENKCTTEMNNKNPRSWFFERTQLINLLCLMKKKREGTNNQYLEYRWDTTIDPVDIKITRGY